MKNLLSSRLLMLLTLLFAVVSAASATDRFYAEAVNFEPGETKTIAFNLDNSQEYFGFQADITLPYGLEVLSVNGKPDVTLSSRANSSYTLVSNQLSAESIRVGAFSTNHTPISGNSGVLLYVNVKASDSFSGGTLSVTDILFTDATNSDMELPDYTAELGTKHNDKFYISNFKIAVGETKEIALVLDNETPFTAFQTDIYLPEGVVIIADSPKMTSRGGSHTLSAKAFTDGRVRLACLSMNNSAFTGNSGELVTLQILATKDVAEKCTIELKNNIFSMTNAKEYVLPNSTTTVTTERALVETITLSNSVVNMVAGENFQLSAEVLPTYASTKDIEWTSSNPAIATVNENGLITALTPGAVVVTAFSVDGSNVSAACDVNVTGIPVTNITLNRTTGSLKVGESLALSATVLPANAYNKSVTWASDNESIVTVDENGMVTAILEGKANVTVASVSNPEVSAVCEIEVTPTPVSAIQLNLSSSSIEVGQQVQLEATVLPATATNKSLNWRSDNPSIATVDENGFVTGIALGSATIFAEATDGSGVTVSCRVSVVPTIATDITIETPSSTTFKVGETIVLSAIVSPDNTSDKSVVWLSKDTNIAVVSPDNATNKSLSWNSNNESIATVDQNGLVTGISVGAVDINARATDGSGVIQAIRINVVPTPVETVSISADGPTTLKATETVQLSALISPSNATDKNVVWSSDNKSIATVDQHGTVTAVSVGKANITAAAGGK